MNNSFSETELSSFNAQYINLNNSAMNNNDSHLPLINIGELADTALRASEYTLSEKNKTIYTNNNMRLQQLEKDIRVFHLYGNACDELLEWLKDDRAYSSINENALINCITAIYEKYAEHGRWSGIQILRTANERCGSLSERGRAIIKRYYNEVCNVSHVRRSSEGSVASNSSANHTAATASPTTSIRSIPPPGAAQSPSSFPSQSPTTSQFPPTQFSGILQNMLETSFVSQPYQQLTPNQQNLLQRQLMLQQQQQFNHRQQQQQQQQTILPQLFQQQQQQQMQISQQQVVNQQQQYQPYQPTQQQVIQQQMLQQKQAQQLAQQKQAQQHAQQQRQAQQQQAQQQAQRQAQQQAQLKAQQLAMLQQQQQYQQQQQQKQQQQQQAMLQQQQLSQALAQQRARQKAMTMARQEYAQQQQQQQQQQQYMQQPHLFHHVPLEQQHTQNVAPPATTSSTGEIVHWTNDLQDQVTRLLNSGPLSPQLTSGPVMLSSSAASTPQPSITMPTSPVRSPASVQRRLSPKAVTTPIAYHRPLHLPSIQIQKPILDKENDTTRFRFSNRYAVKPFRLIHDQQITIKTFFLPKSDIDLLCLNDNILIERDERFPIGFVFTSWYQDGVERKCDWPQTLKVEFNGKILPLQKKSKSTHGSGPPYVGKDYPFDLTKLMRIGENSIKIYQVGCACSYFFCVQIYKRFSINAAKRMIESSTIKIEETERMIRNFLGSMEDGDDDEIVILQRSVKLSLKCPISLKKFKIPTRGKNCKHLDCFDLVPYLLINENNNPQWSCPCCNKPAYPDELARDLLLETLLEKLPKNVAEIEFEKDHKNFKITKVDDPDTDDEEEGEEKSTKEKDELTTITVTKKEEYAELPYNVTVIDLISDDEEEEEGEIAAGNQATTTTPHKRPREE